MTSLLSGRQKYLTYKNTKNGQKARKIITLSALKKGTAGFKSCREPFFEMISFFCTLYPQTHGCKKVRKREKNPRNREISGVRSHDIFFGFTIWLGMKDLNPHKQSQSLSCCHYTNPQYSVCAAFCNGYYYSRAFPNCQVYFRKNRGVLYIFLRADFSA